MFCSLVLVLVRNKIIDVTNVQVSLAKSRNYEDLSASEKPLNKDSKNKMIVVINRRNKTVRSGVEKVKVSCALFVLQLYLFFFL